MSLGVTQAYANLLISPTRINFDSRDRIQEVILINSGSETRTYRLSWIESLATTEGGYQDSDINDPALDPLSPFIRFSPRQVTLAPGERQIIKLQLRRKPDMSESEYRSHLLFTVLPPDVDTGSVLPQTQEGASFKLNLLMNYSIPVLYHPALGNVAVDASFEGINRLNDNSADFKFRLDRTGDVSAFGRIELFSMVDGQRQQIGLANNISVFKELDHRMVSVRVPNFSKFKDKLTELEIRYVGEKEHLGQTFIQKVLQL
jgi:hypothetical protein